jgi:uncharacterized cupredoxin-like copper-binding protein
VRTTLPLPRLAAGLAAGVVAAAVLAGCGSGNSSAAGTSNSAAGSASSSAAGSATSSTTSTVTATEADFSIKLSSSDLIAGTYTFNVTNAGKATHALTIQGPGGLNKTSDTVQGGKSTTMTVTLQSGKYEVFCPVGNHRAMGMDTTLTVK